MPKNKTLTTPVKKANEGGSRVSDVAWDFGVDKSVVSRIFKAKREGNSLERRAKSGRPRKTTDKQERQLLSYVKRDPTKSAVDVKHHANNNLGLEISVHTARRILNRHRPYVQRPARKPQLMKLIESMPRRLETVIKASCGSTKYWFRHQKLNKMLLNFWSPLFNFVVL